MRSSRKSDGLTSSDELVKFKQSGYKYAEDWQEINDESIQNAKQKLLEAKLLGNVAEVIAAESVVEQAIGTRGWQKKDHEMELIWCSFREFSVTYLGKVQPKLAVQQPKVVDIIAYLNYNYRSSKVKLNFFGNKKVRCKGNRIGSLHKCRQAFEWAFMKADYVNVFQNEKSLFDTFYDLSNKMSSKYGHESNQAGFFKVWDDFDRLREYCLETRNDLYGLRAWTMILLMFALFLRRADVTHLTVEGIGIPRSKIDGKPILDEDGYPRYLRLWLRKSKGDGSIQPGGVLFSLVRNYRDRKLCAVVALCDYLNLSGITEGQLFRNFEHGSKSKFKTKGMSLNDVSNVCSATFQNVFGKKHGYSTHSPRRTAANFAAIYGVIDKLIKICGRWKSNVYMRYVEKGRHDTIDQVVGDVPKSQNRWSWVPCRT
jgi:hypothetical protein